MLQAGDTLCGFTVKSTEELAEIDGVAIVMTHEKSGAKLLYLQNDDENKAFSITFKTPPADDTGVFHILEHSVLCGSDKFPVKEPFVNLLRTSMQTFLNAMTFPDKTAYPVASTNEQDLLNLMDVYLDAVLHPALYREREIFQQEGWHYEVERGQDGEARLVYNGVVFNEMKGALSDPENVLYHAMNRELFPDTCYAYESGGRPRAIPKLTYEDYCDAHARHYRLDNAYIVLYGDLDIRRVLGFLSDEYLDREQPPAPGAPNPVGEIRPRRSFGNVVEMETAPENACVGIGYVVGGSSDFERVLATDILMDALMGGNEAPLKRAVLDAQLGGDCTAYLLDSQAAPVAFFMLKGAKPDVAQRFADLIEEQVRKLVEGGIPRDVLEASLAQMSFALRERDRGMADGVVLAVNALSGWLYNDDATLYLRYEEPISHMRAGLEGRYFEDVLSSLVLENDHVALVEVKPVASDGDGEEALELSEKLASLEEDDIAAIEQEVEVLRARQKAPDAPEDLAKLPQLHVSDIGPAKHETPAVLRDDTPVPCLHHDLATRRICYLRLYFDANHIQWEDVPYVTLLAMLLGNLDTEDLTAAELDVHTRSHLGMMRFFTGTTTLHDDPNEVSLRMIASASAISEELENLADIPRSVWATTRFDDASRIRDILVQRRIALEDSFLGEGHTRAMSRANSYCFKSAVISEALAGVDFYRFLKDLIAHFDERFDELRTRLETLRDRIFTKDALTASFTGSGEELKEFWAHAGDFGLADCGSRERSLKIPDPQVKREAFTMPTDVCYVAKSADLGRIDYDGSWLLLGRVMGYDYLWNEVRVKGGAYGCGFRSEQSGGVRFYSYRDPQLDATLARFDEAGTWLAAFDPADDEMEGYIVSAVASHDAPVKPRMIARRQDEEYFKRRPEGWRDHIRETLLSATPDSIRALSGKLDELAQSDAVCVFGSAGIVESADARFGTVSALMEE